MTLLYPVLLPRERTGGAAGSATPSLRPSDTCTTAGSETIKLRGRVVRSCPLSGTRKGFMAHPGRVTAAGIDATTQPSPKCLTGAYGCSSQTRRWSVSAEA